ncbi:recombination regulator RecX [Kitasatospora sp. NPDC056651]|uniref:recombination regulator RecX n=1 Tax=Kitasatospora sp. NPDC056651 TaxID=3345892 RepID=UPI003674A444
MTQYDTVGGDPAGPEDGDYGPPDWFAAVAEEPEPEPDPGHSAGRPRAGSRSRGGRRGRPSATNWASGPEPEFDRAPARAVRGAAPGPEPAEASVEALGLVSASELPTGRRRRRSALVAEQVAEAAGTEAARPGSTPAAVESGWDEDTGEAAGHGGAAASASRRGARRGRARSGRSAEGAPEEEGAERGSRRQTEEPADPESRARDICLRLLTGAAKTRKQLADALRKREIPDEAADEVLTRLEEVGLIDDAAFATAWVESRHAVRGLSRRALAQELRTKGVAADLVEQAVAQLDHDDETDAARALVERKLRSTRGLDAQVRTRRLVGMLARRGYSEGLAFRVVRTALEEESSEPQGGE